MDTKISEYIAKNKVLTLATCVDNVPYCANCFYAFDQENNHLIFLSDDSTRHIQEALSNKKVAGTINTEVTTIAKIQGVQYTGEFIKPKLVKEKEYYQIYYKKFPFAQAQTSFIWVVKLNTVKMTDNTLGFGEKIKWER